MVGEFFMMTLQQIDMSILLWIQEHLRADALTPFWKVITFLGNGGWFWLVLAAGLLVYKKTRPTGIAALLSITVGFLLTNVLLKNIVARPRPFDAYTEIIPLITKPTDFSFPSGHTCASFACALILFRMLPKKFGIPAVILAGMVTFSRLYLGVHYPGDVLGGFLVAVFASTLVYHLMSAYQKKMQEQSEGLSHKWR